MYFDSQGIALLCMGDVNQAIDTLKQACKVHRLCKAPKELQLTVKNAMSLLPSACCSEVGLYLSIGSECTVQGKNTSRRF